MRPLCIYHGNCADGFAAAWVFRRKFSGEVDFHPGVYQTPPPPFAGRRIFMVDFSYKKPVVVDMLKSAASITLIDHHKSALEDLTGVIGQHHCSLERSGAMLAWNFCFPEEEPPQLLRHIEDRDLWLFRLPKTREIQAALFSYPYDFEVWDALMATPVEELAKQGEAIERKHLKDIAELVKVSGRTLCIGGYRVPAANLPYTLSSDAGHLMAQGEPFAACYMDTPEGRVFSLRSAENGVDVSDVAKMYGGGGHVHAAGFKVSFDEAAGFECSRKQC